MTVLALHHWMWKQQVFLWQFSPQMFFSKTFCLLLCPATFFFLSRKCDKNIRTGMIIWPRFFTWIKMRYVKKICSLTFKIELNQFYLWMVVQNTTSNICQYLGVRLTILKKMHYRLVGVGWETNTAAWFFRENKGMFLDLRILLFFMDFVEDLRIFMGFEGFLRWKIWIFEERILSFFHVHLHLDQRWRLSNIFQKNDMSLCPKR